MDIYERVSKKEYRDVSGEVVEMDLFFIDALGNTKKIRSKQPLQCDLGNRKIYKKKTV